MPLTREELQTRFSRHEIDPGSFVDSKQRALRKQAERLAVEINTWAPDCRETSLALTKLEEVVFWTDAALARRMDDTYKE